MNGKQDYTTEPAHRSSETQASPGIARRLRAWWNRKQEAQQVLALDPFERKRMAQDLGVGSTDLAQLVASPPSGATLLPFMMARFGVDAACLAPSARGVLRDMQRVCATCPSKRRCTHALLANASATDCRSFCLNAETLFSLSQGSVAGDQG